MSKIALIGLSALCEFSDFEVTHRNRVATPYGETSASLVSGCLADSEVTFLARDGDEHNVPIHLVNDRANIWALKEAGVERIISVVASGGIRPDLTVGQFAVPDQLIDYTNKQGVTYLQEAQANFDLVDFSYPYSQPIRKALLKVASGMNLNINDEATLGVMSGPRWQTIAEVNRAERDGCHLVGVSSMPEAALARELGIQYAIVALVVCRAAGRRENIAIKREDIMHAMQNHSKHLHTLITKTIQQLHESGI